MSMVAAASDRPWSSEIEAVARSYEALETAGFAKHVQLQRSVTQLIESGALKPGRRMPPEQELARAIRVSLGTVQKALAKLASDGWIVREHGRGTFVDGIKQPITESWHFRFIDPATGRLAPIYSRLLERRLTAAPGPWKAVLGADPQGYVEITRLISVSDRLNCWSRMHLGASGFSLLLELPAETFDNINLKQLFQQRFDMPTLSATQTIKAASFAAPVCKALGLPSGTMGLDLEISTRTRGGRALSYQRMLIPPSDFALDVSPLHGEPPSPR